LYRPIQFIATLLTLVVLSAASNVLWAIELERDYVFRTISSADGLVQNTVNALYQDRRGFMWIGTQGGLHRFDGHHFRVFQNDPARPDTVPDSLITAIDEDADGAIWIGTDGGGAAKIDPDSGAVIERVVLSDRRVTALKYVRGVGIWLGTRSALWLLRPGQHPKSMLKLEHNDAITALEIDLNGELWVGTRRGIYRLRSGRLELLPSNVVFGEVRQFSVDTANRILVAGTEGLFEISPERTTVRRWDQAARNLRAIVQSPDGAIWLAIDDLGLQRLDLASGTKHDFIGHSDVSGGLPESLVSVLLMDNSGQLWVGTRTRGVALTDTAGAPFRLLKNSTENADTRREAGARDVRALCAMDDALWIGTEAGRLLRHGQNAIDDYSALIKSALAPNAGVRINALVCAAKGELILASNVGAYLLSSQQTEITGAPSYRISALVKGEYERQSIRSLLLARDGTIWLGSTDVGLISIDPTRKITEFYGVGPGQMPSAMILSIFEDNEGRIWVGTLDGLALFVPGADNSSASGKERHWSQFSATNNPRSLPGNLIRTLLQQRDGTLWVGTHSGLARLDSLEKTDTASNTWEAVFSRFTMRDGLPNPTVYCLQEDKLARLWLSGNLGLVSFSPARNEWRSFELQDGLQDLEFNGGACLKLPDARLAFGGVNGTNVFRPEAIKASSYLAPIRLLSVRVGGLEVPANRQTHLVRYSDRTINLEFASLDLRSPARNNFAFKLVGFDNNWVSGRGLGQTTYTNLAPGNYRFLARGSNRDGFWNPAELDVELLVLPPWWRTWWAYSLYLLLLAALTSIILWQRKRTRLREQRYVNDLQEREDRLRLSLWGSRDLYWDYSLDESGGENDLLRRAETALVLGPSGDGEFSGQDYLRTQVHPDDVKTLRAGLAQMLRGEQEELAIEHRLKRADGTWTWVLARGRVVRRNISGKPQQIAGTARNMDSVRAAALELEISSRVIDRMSEAVAVSSEDGKLIRVNTAFEQMTGYSQTEVLGRSVALLESPRHDVVQYQSIQDMVRRDGRWRGEMWQRRKDGADILVSIEFTRIEGQQGALPLRVAVMSDITDRKRAEEELRFLANFDSLTGLPNRTMLLTRMARAIARAKRHETKIAMLFLDLDRFKQVNDSLGHAAGDELLRGVADRMRQAVREIDTVARLAGDEFVLLVEEISTVEDAHRAAERVLERFGEPFNLAGTDVVISPSIGLSVFPDHGERPDELLKCADLAMYAAKSAGRNTIRLYESEQSAAAIERAETENLLRRALDRDQFEVYYQIAVDLRSTKPVGVEALLRWRHPQLGLTAPDAFVPILEDSGLIVSVGKWVIHEALAQLRAWDLAGLGELYVSVNLSILQLSRGDLVGDLPQLLQRYGIVGERLTLELTESLVMANPEQSIATLNRLSGLGVQIAVDDFGTGYSSLAYLKRLPIDKLKIDKTFVRDLGADAEDTAITHSIIALGQALGLIVVAEGVESETQQALLRALGCQQAQGYLYAMPLPAVECTKLLRERLLKHD
jgi:diguanylate cyclase (GGDEF)-like protein/PAS domain S-box-containing protein